MPQITAKELRQAAQELAAASSGALSALGGAPADAAAPAPGAQAEASPPLARGDLQQFPRPSPEQEEVEQGLFLLQESAANAAAVLRALAAVAEAQGGQVPAILLAPYQAYLDALRAKGP